MTDIANDSRTFTRVIPGQEPEQATEPVEDVYIAPETLPKSYEIRTSLLDARREVAGIEERLNNARSRFLNAQGGSSDRYLSPELQERAAAERWDTAWPDFEAAEREALDHIKQLNDVISTATRHVEQLALVETIPPDTYAQASQALPFVQGEVAGMSGVRLAQRLSAVSAINDPAQVLAWRLAGRQWLQANPTDQKRNDVENLIGQLGAIFRTSDPGAPVRDAHAIARSTVSKLEAKIRAAQKARGGGHYSPSHWGLASAPNAPRPRIHGYER